MRTLPRRQPSPDQPPAPSLPGLTLCRPLTPGAAGPPWRAKDLRSGYDVVVRSAPDAVTADELGRRVAALPDHPHVLRPALVDDAADAPLLVTRLAASGSLADLVSRRGRLTAAESSGLGLAIGRALAALHASGVTHNALTSSTVLVAADARPFLDAVPCLDRGPCLDEGTASAARVEDVVALAGLLRDVTAVPVPAALSRVIDLAADPQTAPAASELGGLLVAAVAPEPLRLVVPEGAEPESKQVTAAGGAGLRLDRFRRPRADRPRRRRARHEPSARPLGKVLAVIATAVAALSGAVWAGTFWASYADGPPRSRPLAELAPVATTTPLPPMPISPTFAANGVGAAPVDWTQVLADLDSRREEAFGNDDPDGLTDVDAPGSPVLASDRAALEAMAAAGVDAAGFREIIDSVRPLAVSAGGVLLRVVDERPAYALVRVTDGAVVASRPARAARAWQVALVRGAAGWQVRDVRPSG